MDEVKINKEFQFTTYVTAEDMKAWKQNPFYAIVIDPFTEKNNIPLYTFKMWIDGKPLPDHN